MNVYISYAQADEKVAWELARCLTSEGFAVCYPNDNLFPGDNWALESGKALEKSEAMVVLLSPASAKSEWVRREISYALGSPKYKWRLIPVNLRPAKEVPWILANLPPVSASGNLALTARKVAERIRHPIKRFKRVAATKAA